MFAREDRQIEDGVRAESNLPTCGNVYRWVKQKINEINATLNCFQNKFLSTHFVLVCLLIFGYSIFDSWNVTNILLFTSDNTPLRFKITMEQISWVTSLESAGVVVGVLGFGFISNVVGRKPPLLIIGALISVRLNVHFTHSQNFPQILFSFVIHFHVFPPASVVDRTHLVRSKRLVVVRCEDVSGSFRWGCLHNCSKLYIRNFERSVRISESTI